MTLISRALNKGDVTAAELVLRHIWPVRKGAPVQIDIPKITSPERVLEATAKVKVAVSDGSLSPDESLFHIARGIPLFSAKKESAEL